MDRQRAEPVKTLRNGTVTTITFIPFFVYLFVRFVFIFIFIRFIGESAGPQGTTGRPQKKEEKR